MKLKEKITLCMLCSGFLSMIAAAANSHYIGLGGIDHFHTVIKYHSIPKYCHIAQA